MPHPSASWAVGVLGNLDMDSSPIHSLVRQPYTNISSLCSKAPVHNSIRDVVGCLHPTVNKRGLLPTMLFDNITPLPTRQHFILDMGKSGLPSARPSYQVLLSQQQLVPGTSPSPSGQNLPSSKRWQPPRLLCFHKGFRVCQFPQQMRLSSFLWSSCPRSTDSDLVS